MPSPQTIAKSQPQKPTVDNSLSHSPFSPEESKFINTVLIKGSKNRPKTTVKLMNAIKGYLKNTTIKPKQAINKLIDLGYCSVDENGKKLTYHLDKSQSYAGFDSQEKKVIQQLSKARPTTREKLMTYINKSTSSQLNKQQFYNKLINCNLVTFNSEDHCIYDQKLFG